MKDGCIGWLWHPASFYYLLIHVGVLQYLYFLIAFSGDPINGAHAGRKKQEDKKSLYGFRQYRNAWGVEA